jgi:peptidoglycan-associated lipoprotein
MTVKTLTLSIASSLAVLLSGCASEQINEASSPQSNSRAPQAASQSPASALASRSLAANPQPDPGNMLAKRSVYYDFDQYDFKSEYRPIVEAHAAYLRSHAAASLRIEGNADERGSREYNLALGQRRADSVKRALQLMGIAEERIETISWGEEKPSPMGHDESVWAQHRRSDITYTQQ